MQAHPLLDFWASTVSAHVASASLHTDCHRVNLKSMLLFSSFLLMLHILIHLLSAFIFIFILLVLVANLYAWLSVHMWQVPLCTLTS
jgi:hypothetical protein